MRRLSAPRWPVGVVAAGLVALFAAGAAAQPGRRLGPNTGPPAAGPGFPAAGGEDVTEYECLSCHHKFTSRTVPERCPSCNVIIGRVTDSATGKTTTTDAGRRLGAKSAIGGGVTVALIVVGVVVRLVMAGSRGRSSSYSSPPPRRRKPRPRPRPEPEDDEDDRPARRSARARDDDEDDAPPPRPKARTAPVSADPPRRARPVKPAADDYEVVDDAPQFEVVDEPPPPRRPRPSR